MERIPAGTGKAEFMAAHKMSPEAEAAIVHQVPSSPVIIDVRYEPEQVHLFDGQQLGFAVGNDGQLYAFTEYEDLEKFLEREGVPVPDFTGSLYSFYFEDPFFNGSHQQAWVPNTTVFSLSTYYMNDIISSMRISEFTTNGCTIFEHDNLQGNYLPANAGSNWPDLGYWDNRASSLVVWPR